MVGPGSGALVSSPVVHAMERSVTSVIRIVSGGAKGRNFGRMRLVFTIAIAAGLVAGLIVAVARTVDLSQDTPASATPAADAPTATPEPGDPADLAMRFSTAVMDRDIPALYALLDEASRRVYTLDDLEAAYANYFEETTATTLTLDLRDATVTGAVFDVSLATAYFGDLQYSISVPFTGDGGGRAISWAPPVIHPSLRPGLAFESTIERPSRGAILDRNGAPLAQTADVRYLALDRVLVQDRAAATARLEAVGFARAAIDAAFDSTLPLNQRSTIGVVPDAIADTVNLAVLETPGLYIYFESQRVHPLGAAAAHVVGYTRELTAEELEARSGEGLRPGDRVGATGLEAGLNDMLAGQSGGELHISNGAGGVLEVLVTREFREGQDVTTTLDAGVLQAVQARLGERHGAAVVMDPRSNAILALNSSPSFDPDAFERGDAAALQAITSAPGSPLNNRATLGLYSAGSTFKLITGTAALLSGLYTPDSFFECGATWAGVEPARRNWEGAQGPLTIAGGLMRSCNPVFYEIGLQLYNNFDDFLPEIARKFGFGVPTGVVGIYDEAGLVPDSAWKSANRGEPWYPGDEVNLAIGQGDLLVTPLQLANAYSTFINNSLRTPVILASEQAVDRGALGLTPEQHAHLLSGLKLVTSASGTASAAFANAGYFDFGGKSGTAEDAGEQQHVLFVAFSPADAPAAVAAVVLDDGESGSIEAGPMARDMVLAALP